MSVSASGGRQTPEARKAAQRKRYEARRDSGHKRAYMREFYAKRKQRLTDLKAGRACERCGFDDPRALDFHHRDPADKEFNIGQKAWQVSWERLMVEVAKCDVICSNCHRIEHYDDVREGRPREY